MGPVAGRLAFHAALDLAILFGARVVGATVREVSPLARPEALEAAYVERLKAAVEEQARAAGVAFEHVLLSGHAGRALREQARATGADLVVLGATGLEHPWSPTIGGTAGSVAAQAPCSVLLIWPPQAILHVRDVMTRAVSSVTPDTPLAEVVDFLLRGDVKALPVVDTERRPVGTSALMAPFLVTVRPGDSLAHAIRLMMQHRVKRLVVVDEDGRFRGLVDRREILKLLTVEPGAAADQA